MFPGFSPGTCEQEKARLQSGAFTFTIVKIKKYGIILFFLLVITILRAILALQAGLTTKKAVKK